MYRCLHMVCCRPDAVLRSIWSLLITIKPTVAVAPTLKSSRTEVWCGIVPRMRRTLVCANARSTRKSSRNDAVWCRITRDKRRPMVVKQRVCHLLRLSYRVFGLLIVCSAFRYQGEPCPKHEAALVMPCIFVVFLRVVSRVCFGYCAVRTIR